MNGFVERTACPVCATPGFSVVHDAPFTAPNVRGFIETHYRDQGVVDFARFADARYVIAHCGTCDLLFQVFVPDDAMMGHLYNEMIEPATLHRVEQALLTADNVAKVVGELSSLFQRTGKPFSQIRMLDYGFGFGRWSRVARGLGAEVFATELGEEKRAIAASLGVRIIDDAEIDEMQFDIVHTEQVLEHLAEPGRDFARLARAATTLFKVAVPRPANVATLLARQGLPAVSPYYRMTNGGPAHRHDHSFIAVQPLEHINSFSARTMRWLGARNQLELVSRVRLGTVAMDIGSATGIARSLRNLAQMTAKAMLRPDRGYFLFRRRG